MFQWKSTFPARPTLPTFSEQKNDLTQLNSDVIIKLASENTGETITQL